MSKAKKDDTKKTDDKKNKTPSTTENKGQDDQKGPGNTDTQAQAVLVEKPKAEPKPKAQTLEEKVEALEKELETTREEFDQIIDLLALNNGMGNRVKELRAKQLKKRMPALKEAS